MNQQSLKYQEILNIILLLLVYLHTRYTMGLMEVIGSSV